jgi:hypothetical protein
VARSRRNLQNLCSEWVYEGMTEKTYTGTYLILSLKWSDGLDKLNWWGPDNNGYCYCIDKAGRYTAEQIAAKPHYYDNEDSTRAVPLDDVLSGKLGQIQKIVAASFRYARRRFDCHGCGEEVVYRYDPRFSPPTCHQCGKKVCDICADERRCKEELEESGVRSATEEDGA